MVLKRINWSYYDKDNQLIPPLTYDNRKTQKTIINEALEALDDHDVLFIQGGVGTGKSVIALHLIAHYKKGIIAVPTKALEDQYVQDYCGAGKNTIRTQQSEPLNVNNLRAEPTSPAPTHQAKPRSQWIVDTRGSSA
jgi:superfamily II DNA or RNA helicase